MSDTNCCCNCCCSCSKAGCGASCNCRQNNTTKQYEQQQHPEYHKQLNEQFAKTGVSYRLKDNGIKTNGCCSNAKSHHLWNARKGGLELARGTTTNNSEIHDSNDRLIAHMSSSDDCYAEQRPDSSKYHATLQNYYRYHDHCNTVARTGFTRNPNGGFYRRC